MMSILNYAAYIKQLKLNILLSKMCFKVIYVELPAETTSVMYVEMAV